MNVEPIVGVSGRTLTAPLSELALDFRTEVIGCEADFDDDAQASPVRGSLRPFAAARLYGRINRSEVRLSSIKMPAAPLFRKQYLEPPLGTSGTDSDRNGDDNDSIVNTPTRQSSVSTQTNTNNIDAIEEPATKIRRTQSMFATPEQMLHDEVGDMFRAPEGLLESGSFLARPECTVPVFYVRKDPFPRLTHRTLVRLLNGEFRDCFREVVVVDCRFEYEFEGGHIMGAINVNTKQQLEKELFGPAALARGADAAAGRQLLVFHCEYSAFRSPLMASYLRRLDRAINAQRYPTLQYPDVAVLDGGYSQFYAFAQERCVPRNYVGMNTREHERTCKREMHRFRRGMKSDRKQPR